MCVRARGWAGGRRGPGGGGGVTSLTDSWAETGRAARGAMGRRRGRGHGGSRESPANPKRHGPARAAHPGCATEWPPAGRVGAGPGIMVTRNLNLPFALAHWR